MPHVQLPADVHRNGCSDKLQLASSAPVDPLSSRLPLPVAEVPNLRAHRWPDDAPGGCISRPLEALPIQFWQAAVVYTPPPAQPGLTGPKTPLRTACRWLRQWEGANPRSVYVPAGVSYCG